jgi:hypothetical protein
MNAFEVMPRLFEPRGAPDNPTLSDNVGLFLEAEMRRALFELGLKRAEAGRSNDQINAEITDLVPHLREVIRAQATQFVVQIVGDKPQPDSIQED